MTTGCVNLSCVFYALALISVAAVLVGVLGVRVVNALGRSSERFPGRISLVSVFVGAACMIKAAYGVLFLGQHHIAFLDIGAPLAFVPLQLDGLSAFFLCLISVMGVLTALYMQGYVCLNPNKNLPVARHYMLFNLLIASMVVVVIVKNTIAFVMAWETMLLCAFFILLSEHKGVRTRTIALVYLAYMHVGVVVLMAGFAAAGVYCGGMNLEDLAALQWSSSGGGVYYLLLVGFALMAGIVPFHSWITLKTSNTSTGNDLWLLSGLLTNMGVYGILRVIAETRTAPKYAGYVVLAFSVVTGLWGAINSIMQGDLRRIVLYNGIENVGIIGIGIGAGLIGHGNGLPLMAALGFSGAVFHTLNQTLFRGLLTYSVGAFVRAAHTSHLDLIGGLIKSMPLVAFLFLCGCVCVCGLPPFNGFVSIAVIFMGLLGAKTSANGAVLSVGVLGIASLALINGLTAIAFIKASGYALLSQPRSTQAAEAEPSPRSMTLPMVALAAVSLAIGLMPEPVLGVVKAVLLSMHISADIAIQETSTLVSSISRASLLPVFATVAILLLRSLTPKAQPIALVQGVGGQRSSASFFVAGSAPMVAVVARVASIVQGAGRVLPWSWQRARRALEVVGWLQGGQMRHYILYLLATLLITLLIVSG
ncbi:NADH dehydrogenase (quinone) [Candidatus Magnetobacterium bavaricum]|uniref:NADH dehydrogenase (Quinone) n=1 Tax=Candidatus Magnetobacterium bavaricum TaxID=29290 RepID=A0A0F3GQF1_9BACT|nr:NADH dehydrogenase (quinone) [Candidatus Magnetobacterium bavaricum]